MKTVNLKIKKSIRANVSATNDSVKLRFPKQCLGVVSINFTTSKGEIKTLKSFELWITEGGDKIKAEVLS